MVPPFLSIRTKIDDDTLSVLGNYFFIRFVYSFRMLCVLEQQNSVFVLMEALIASTTSYLSSSLTKTLSSSVTGFVCFRIFYLVWNFWIRETDLKNKILGMVYWKKKKNSLCLKILRSLWIQTLICLWSDNWWFVCI